MMEIRHRVPLKLPAAQIDLGAWLYTLTNDAYRRCCNRRLMKNLALGYYTEHGKRGMVNVEWLAVALTVHFFLEQTAAPHAIAMHSGHSRLYVLGCIPLSLSVTRELWIEPVASQEVMLYGRTHITYHNRLLGLLAGTWPGRVAAKMYFAEELSGFARDILAKSTIAH
jgi:hypothetical protein